jgi:tetratricopeptide (TPR) repeat protein
MLELYVFLAAAVVIAVILGHRYFAVKRAEKKAFKRKVSEKVEQYRMEEKEEGVNERFREVHHNKHEKSFDPARYKEEIRQADLAMARGQYDEAKKHLIQAISLAEDELPPTLKLARVFLESGDLKRSEALYRRLIDEDPDNPDVYENLARILVRKKDYKGAIQAYVRAVELDENDDRKLVALGKIYHLMMRYSVAAECFRKAAELKPREVDYLFMLAESCAADDDYENALFSYERILTVEPYNEKAKHASHDVRLKIKEQENLFAKS